MLALDSYFWSQIGDRRGFGFALDTDDLAPLLAGRTALDSAGVGTTGVKTDVTLGKRYVASKAPDRIAWELYMA